MDIKAILESLDYVEDISQWDLEPANEGWINNAKKIYAGTVNLHNTLKNEKVEEEERKKKSAENAAIIENAKKAFPKKVDITLCGKTWTVPLNVGAVNVDIAKKEFAKFKTNHTAKFKSAQTKIFTDITDYIDDISDGDPNEYLKGAKNMTELFNKTNIVPNSAEIWADFDYDPKTKKLSNGNRDKIVIIIGLAGTLDDEHGLYLKWCNGRWVGADIPEGDLYMYE